MNNGTLLPCKKAAYTKKQAATVRNQREREGSGTLRIYPCPRCGHWHLTHKPNLNA